MTKHVGLIGRGLKHSISPQFQQAAFDHLDLDVRYEIWDTDENELPAPEVMAGLVPDPLAVDPATGVSVAQLDPRDAAVSAFRQHTMIARDPMCFSWHITSDKP